MKELTLDTVADGVANELFQREMANIASNICDQNTKAKGKRTLAC
jgi:hypothetical protein